MIPVIAIRPEPGLASTIEAGRNAGLSILGFPLSRIEGVDWETPVSADFDGLLIGSANAIRHGGGKLNELRDLPVLAVGSATGEVAASAGFEVEQTGTGGLQQLLDNMSDSHRRLLRLSGEERISLTLPPGISIVERVVYRVCFDSISENLVNILKNDAIILLHSAEAAGHFAKECDRLSIARQQLCLASLGPRIRDAAGSGWKKSCAASEPNDHALLALAHDMCH